MSNTASITHHNNQQANMKPIRLLTILFALIGSLNAADNTPPEGFRALFNGKDLTGWRPNVHWSAKDGELLFEGKGGDLYHTEDFANFVLLVDWKVPEKGNSGVFLRGGAAQVEINNEDKEKSPPHNATTGGLYPDQAPLKRAAKPAGEWNHYEIRVEKGKVTVFLNGEKTLDAFAKNWGVKLKGPIGFQSHGSPLAYRNIFIKPLED